MASTTPKRARLDRFISQKMGINRRNVRLLIAQSRIVLDGKPATEINQVIDQFTHIVFDQKVLQDNSPCYLMMNKPTGVVSATKDPKHTTVMDLLQHRQKDSLHIVGRLDYNSSGLLLLTNDGRWSRRLMDLEHKVQKWYRVTLGKPLHPDYIEAFAEGMHFPFEDITTKPATLRIVSEYEAEVGLVEGRYHQVKRMFGRFRNPVVELHRLSIGEIGLDEALGGGEWRALMAEEINKVIS